MTRVVWERWWEGVKKYRVVNGVENQDSGVLRCAIGMKSGDLFD